MANVISGTITGTGATAAINGTKFTIVMNFAGTASVDIEMRAPDGNFIKIPDDGTGIAADNVLVAEFPTQATLRLNCTAYTNDVAWKIETV